MTAIRLTILGQAVSKANRAKIITLAGHASLVKSKEAQAYHRDALRQIPAVARVRLDGPVCVTMRLWYASERPDLDESIVLDALQDQWSRKRDAKGNRVLVQAGVFKNDRQVREKHVHWGLDKANPRAEILVEPIHPQQQPLTLDTREEAEAF